MDTLSNWGVVDNKNLNQTKLWLCFAAVFVFGFVSTFNMFKTSGILIPISNELGIAPADRGFVMSSYAFASMILAYPGMWIMRKFGIKFSLTVSSVLMVIGTLMGYISHDATMFLAGRVVEGCAFGLICVIGPNVVARLFPKKQLGRAMGFWSLWMPIGTVIAFFAAPAMMESLATWRPLWLIAIILDIVSLALILVWVKMPKVAANEGGGRYKGKKAGTNFTAAAIILGAVFVIWAYIYIVNINTFYASFLQEEKGMGLFASSMLPEIIAIIHIITGIVISLFADRIKHWRAWIWIPFLLVGFLMIFCAFTPGTDMVGPYIFAVVMGVLCSMLPMALRTYIPMLVTNQRLCDLGLATMAFATGVAKCLANIASWTIAEFGYTFNGEFVLGPLAILGAVIVLVFVTPDKKLRAAREADAALEAGDASTGVDDGNNSQAAAK